MVSKINNINVKIMGLFSNNYLNQFYIRQMAKIIGKSHVSLLSHLKDLETIKVLISKNVGKSKVYSLNLENNQVREFLSFAEKTKSLEFLKGELFIKKIYEEFIDLDLNGALILFGIYASKMNHGESDIDLLYLGNLKESVIKKIKELGKMYKKEIHLIVMNTDQFREQLSNQGALVKEIINNHLILYNHDIFINEVWRYYVKRREE